MEFEKQTNQKVEDLPAQSNVHCALHHAEHCKQDYTQNIVMCMLQYDTQLPTGRHICTYLLLQNDNLRQKSTTSSFFTFDMFVSESCIVKPCTTSTRGYNLGVCGICECPLKNPEFGI